MPLMSIPLAHVEGVLNGIQFDMENLRRERYKIEAKLSVLEDLQGRLDIALSEERKKNPSAPGDAPRS